MTDITFPPEALEAAARANYEAQRHRGDLSWEDLGTGLQNLWRKAQRAACLAMIRNWPGMRQMGADDSVIYLPLPQKETSA